MSQGIALRMLAVTISMLMASSSKANVILNPSFETNVIASFTSYSTGSTAMTPWSITGDVTLVNATGIYPPAAVGNQWLSLESSSSDGTVSQTFATVPGATYSASFQHTVLGRGGALTWNMSYDYGGGPNPLSRPDPGDQVVGTWTTEAFSFTATGTTTTLSFTGENQVSGFYGFGVDNVIVTLESLPVPEPSAACLLAMGATVLAWQSWRRLPRLKVAG